MRRRPAIAVLLLTVAASILVVVLLYRREPLESGPLEKLASSSVEAGTADVQLAAPDRPEPEPLIVAAAHVPAPAQPAPRAPQGPPLAVFVADDHGVPVAGARIDAWSESIAGPPQSSFATDVTGWWRTSDDNEFTAFAAAKAGVGTSGIWTEAHEPWSPSAVEDEKLPTDDASGERRVMLVLRPQAHLQGRVLDVEGRPLADAVVTVAPTYRLPDSMTPRTPGLATSGTDGTFSLDVDAPSSITLHGAAAKVPLVDVRLAVAPGEVVHPVLQPAGAFVIQGSVTKPDGTPAAQARIKTAEWYIDDVAARTGDDGTFRVTLSAPGEYSIHVAADGLLQAGPVTVQLTEEDRVATVSVQLVAPTSISGRVIRSTGEPVSDALVSAMLSDSASPADRSFAGSQSARTNSAGDGSFQLEQILPGREYTLRAYGHVMNQSVRARAVPHILAGARDVTVMIDPETEHPWIVTATVVDQVTRAPLEAIDIRHGLWTGGRIVASDSPVAQDGVGRFHFEADNWTMACGIEILAEGYPPTLVGPLTPTAEGLNVEVQLARHGSLAVQVADEDGNPVMGALVVLTRNAPNDARWNGASPAARTGASGAAAWDSLVPGSYSVSAAKAELRSEVVGAIVPPEGHAAVTLKVTSDPQLGTINILVKHADGSPVLGASISCLDANTAFGEHTEADADSLGADQAVANGFIAGAMRRVADKDGRVAIDVPPGQYYVWTPGENRSASWQWVEVARASTASCELRCD